ncbi:MAG TPA: ABC transporter permease [Blastocatellia bacterium]|nr:ABC transporter permease [Blastocatellia bacterium]
MTDWKNEVRQRLSGLQLDPAREADLAEELGQHFELRYQELLSQRVSAAEATRDVLAELSDGALLAQELRRVERCLKREPDARQTRRLKIAGDLWRDIRYGGRLLARRPAFASIAVLTLALGIGANTAIFSVVYAVLLRPLPYVEADRLVWLNEKHDQIATRWVSYPNFRDWGERNQSFDSLALIRGWQLTLTGSGEAQSVNARMVTADYFRVMRVSPLIGRTFNDELDKFGSPRVAVLSHAFWQSQFGGDPEIIGKQVTLDNEPFTVIGVIPPEFQHQGPPALWVSTEQYAEPGSGWYRREDRVAGFVIGRLKPEVTIEQARSDMKSIEQQLISEYPMQNGGNAIHLATLQDSIVGNSRQSLLLLFAAVGVVLLIACANVANLLLARAATRKKEFAIRAAMGASRARVLRQLLVESIMLAIAGGALSLLVARWCLDLLLRFAPQNLPRMSGVTIGWRVMAFTLGLSALTGIIFGIAPAWHSTKTDLQETLKEGGRTTTDAHGGRLRSAFVVAEVALAMVLLVGAGLLIKSLVRMLASDPGFKPDNVVTMQLLPRQSYPTVSQLKQFYSQILERIGALSGVEAVCVLNDDLPGLEPGWQNDINPEVNGEYLKIKPGDLINVDWGIVSAEYFKTMGIPIKQGRSFTPQEAARGAKVLLVDEQLARQFWPHGDALGKHIKYDSPDPHEIIGVAGDVRNFGSEALGRIKIYTPFERRPLPRSTLAVRTAGADASSLVAAIREEVRAVNPNVPVDEIGTLEDRLAGTIAPRRFITWLLGLFAAVALLLAALGIYGVMSYSVTERTHEIGVRRALGAQDRNVLALVVRRSLTLTLIGAAIGLAASVALSRVLSSLLFGVTGIDPVTFTIVLVLMVAVALLASYMPARRAIKVDPMVALRYE